MIDIETLGVSPNSIVLSIGAVEFTDKIEKEFEVFIDPTDCQRHGLEIEASTVIWWMEQNEAARNALLRARRVPLIGALSSFVDAFEWEGKKVWCNGASFDFPILENLFRILGVQAPWKFWDTMDMRTLKNLVPRKVYETCKVEPKFAHGALEDAKAQALTTINLLKKIKT